MESITVITITRNRPKLLKRAIASVQKQKCCCTFKHLVLVDDCEKTQRMLKKNPYTYSNFTWHFMPRLSWERSGPGRSSRLRNHGVKITDSQWICFLDDDNEWKENHLQELIDCLHETGFRAAHSHMIIVNKDGTPFLDRRLPWCRNLEEGKQMYIELCSQGVFTPGSCIVKDRADPIDHPNPVRTVDTGEWLLARELLIEVPFRDDFNAVDEANVTGEDDKLLTDLINKKEPIACSNQPTLIYYLGGYSNNFDGEYDSSFAWR